MTRILRIDGSARTEGSVTRQLTDRLVDRLVAVNPGAEVITRDLLAGVPLLDHVATTAIGNAEVDRSAAQVDALAISEELIEEFLAADIVVLGSPIYNFSVPASVKAYIDQISRAGRTFRYTDQGPIGLVADRPTYLVVASGGTAVGGAPDFATPYLRHVLEFLGVRDVSVIAADLLMIDADGGLARAHSQIEAAIPIAAAA